MLNPEVFFILCIFSLVFLVCRRIYKLGRRTRDADNAEEVLESVAKAKKARDDLSVSPSKSARVRAKYRR